MSIGVVRTAPGKAARESAGGAPLLYLDQNYVSGMAKGKPAFCDLEPVLREAVAGGVVGIPESWAHRVESGPRPDLGLLDLVRELSGGLRLPSALGPRERECGRRLRRRLARDFPERRPRSSDAVDVAVLAAALPRCRLVTCDAFMADVARRAGLDVQFGCELFTGRRPDVSRLTGIVESLVRDGGSA